MAQTGFSGRLEIALQGESLHSFSKRSGIGDSTLRKYLEGSEPGMDKVLRIADAAGVTLDWLIAERGPMKAEARSIAPFATSELSLPGFTLVPRLDVRASAGNGFIPYSDETLDYLAFQEGWLRARGVNPGAARVITATGDSMETTIRDGDVLLVDTSIDRVKDNAIYVVVYGDMILVKRIHRRINGSMQLISDNEKYPSEDVSAGDVQLITIAGRVMWFGRSM